MNFSKQDNWEECGNPQNQIVEWAHVFENAEHLIYEAGVVGSSWIIRLNDFPDEPLYTLLINGEEIIHFNEWPVNWKKPFN
jgi:hypothetical protein